MTLKWLVFTLNSSTNFINKARAFLHFKITVNVCKCRRGGPVERSHRP